MSAAAACGRSEAAAAETRPASEDTLVSWGAFYMVLHLQWRFLSGFPVLFPVTSHLMVGAFILMVSMILMNVLFGLAVADIQVRN